MVPKANNVGRQPDRQTLKTTEDLPSGSAPVPGHEGAEDSSEVCPAAPTESSSRAAERPADLPPPPVPKRQRQEPCVGTLPAVESFGKEAEEIQTP